MNKTKAKLIKKDRRKIKIRVKVSGTQAIPRLSVFRSNTSLFLQLIDDVKGVTIVSAHSREIKIAKEKSENDLAGKIAIAFELGKLIGKKALEKKVGKVVFDRGGNRYHGRVKAAAEGAREAGLIF